MMPAATPGGAPLPSRRPRLPAVSVSHRCAALLNPVGHQVHRWSSPARIAPFPRLARRGLASHRHELEEEGNLPRCGVLVQDDGRRRTGTRALLVRELVAERRRGRRGAMLAVEEGRTRRRWRTRGAGGGETSWPARVEWQRAAARLDRGGRGSGERGGARDRGIPARRGR